VTQPIEVFGLLGPEQLPSTRRLRTLGLGATVRYFNDRAVPGMGGVWFAKQLVLALFGVHMAEQTGRSKVEVANAIEALGCWMAINRQRGTRDPRIRGVRKLSNVGKEELAYERVRKRGFYVSQPMRMATVQPLPALGLVKASSSRFNSFTCTEKGKDLLKEFTDVYRPSNGDLAGTITRWIRGEKINPTEKLRQALDPREPLPERVRILLLEQLKQGRPDEPDEDRLRRRDAREWVDWIRRHRREAIDWTRRPDQIKSDSHWHDLEAGRRFLVARNAALDVLIALESHMPTEGALSIDRSLLEKVSAEVDQLAAAARDFLATDHPNPEAKRFCAECVVADRVEVIRSLVDRDRVILVRIGDRIAPGPLFVKPPQDEPKATTPDQSFDATADDVDGDEGPRSAIQWPPGTSYRINHLFLLNLDLHGELTTELNLDRGNMGAAQ